MILWSWNFQEFLIYSFRQYGRKVRDSTFPFVSGEPEHHETLRRIFTRDFELKLAIRYFYDYVLCLTNSLMVRQPFSIPTWNRQVYCFWSFYSFQVFGKNSPAARSLKSKMCEIMTFSFISSLEKVLHSTILSDLNISGKNFSTFMCKSARWRLLSLTDSFHHF